MSQKSMLIQSADDGIDQISLRAQAAISNIKVEDQIMEYRVMPDYVGCVGPNWIPAGQC